jgi:hypothetical protein
VPHWLESLSKLNLASTHKFIISGNSIPDKEKTQAEACKQEKLVKAANAAAKKAGEIEEDTRGPINVNFVGTSPPSLQKLNFTRILLLVYLPYCPIDMAHGDEEPFSAQQQGPSGSNVPWR